MSQIKNVKGTPSQASTAGFVFKKILSIVLVAIGFILMMGTEDIYSFTKITLAPIVVVAGFALGFVAILYKPKTKTN